MARLRSEQFSTHWKRNIQCYAERCVITSRTNAARWSGSSFAGRTYLINRRIPNCPKRSRPVRSPSLLWAPSQEAGGDNDVEAHKFGGQTKPMKNKKIKFMIQDKAEKNSEAGLMPDEKL